MATELTCLDLDEEGFTDLYDGVEHAFGLPLPARARDWTTVGDIQAWLLAEIPASDQAGKCATSMAFYRLRAALRPLASGPVRPNTPLTAFGLSPRRLQRHLSAALDFPVQVQTLGWVAVAGIALFLAGLGLALVEARFLWLLAPAIALIGLDRGLFSHRTVGDVARLAASANFAAFAVAGADRRPAAVWAALRGVIAQSLDLDGAITPTTRLFPAAP